MTWLETDVSASCETHCDTLGYGEGEAVPVRPPCHFASAFSLRKVHISKTAVWVLRKLGRKWIGDLLIDACSDVLRLAVCKNRGEDSLPGL
mmetsp:Transcript_52697/g.73082  ORF Transcript_52697/g.73082 Transcript_52697/m.73082 type:complete len:91 (+) Transcript_52697:50-322(+)